MTVQSSGPAHFVTERPETTANNRQQPPTTANNWASVGHQPASAGGYERGNGRRCGILVPAAPVARSREGRICVPHEWTVAFRPLDWDTVLIAPETKVPNR